MAFLRDFKYILNGNTVAFRTKKTAGAAPNTGSPPPLQRVADEIVACVYLR